MNYIVIPLMRDFRGKQNNFVNGMFRRATTSDYFWADNKVLVFTEDLVDKRVFAQSAQEQRGNVFYFHIRRTFAHA